MEPDEASAVIPEPVDAEALTTEAPAPLRPLEELETILGYEFANREYLKNALVHKSHLHDIPDFYLGSNERLEFLGDAVLGLIVSAELFLEHPEMSEGELTGLRGALVRKSTLASLADPLKLGQFLFLSRGEEAAGGRVRGSNAARLVEAILGAVYLDGGLEAATRVWHRIRGEQGDEALHAVLMTDYKSQLQRLAQARLRLTPSYRLVGTSGPEHSKLFEVEALLGDRAIARGVGSSKQLAQQAAAQGALGILTGELGAEGQA